MSISEKAKKVIREIPSDFSRLDFIELAFLAIDQVMPAEDCEDASSLEKVYSLLGLIRNSETICTKSFRGHHRWLLPEWHKLDNLYFQRCVCSECGKEKTSGHCYEKPEGFISLEE